MKLMAIIIAFLLITFSVIKGGKENVLQIVAVMDIICAIVSIVIIFLSNKSFIKEIKEFIHR